MNIVFLGDSIALQNAGIQRYNSGLFEDLSAYRGIGSMRLVTPHLLDDYPEWQQIVVPIKNSIPGHQRIRQFTSIPRALERKDVDLVVEPAHLGPFNLPKSLKRCTVIHDLTPITHGRFHGLGSRISHQLLLPGIIAKSNLLITNSEATKSEVISRYRPRCPVQVVYPKLGESSLVATRLDSKPYILSIGTLEPRKNYLAMLQAFEIVADIYLEYQLCIIGGQGWKHTEFDKYLALSRHRKRVQLLGYVSEEEKRSYMVGASIYASTSIAEGLGMPLMEMLKTDVPVLCSDLPSYKEIGGLQFQYFEARDVERLAQLLKENIGGGGTKVDYQSSIDLWNKKRAAQLQELYSIFEGWKS